MSKIPTFKLSNGQHIPVVGLGTYKTEKEPEKLKNAVKEAIKCGYRHIDCAYAYENEDVIGKAIKEALNETNGKLYREDLFIVSKLWNTFHSRDEAHKIIDVQLKNFGFNYLDLYIMHWPMGLAEKTGKIFPTNENGEPLFSDVHYTETYKALEELINMNKVKSIGLSNFNIEQIKDILNNCKIKPVVNQIEVHPYFQNSEVVEFCQKNDIQVIAYCPMGAADRPWRKPEDPILLEDETIKKIAKKYNKTPGQICLRWNIQRNIVVIPKSVTPSRINENINIFDFKLSDEDMQEIKKIDCGFRYYPFPELKAHKLHPFKEAAASSG